MIEVSMQARQMDNLKKYCSILGVQAGDSAEIVKEAFRLRIREVHPDREGGDSEATKLLIEAYRELKNGVPRYSAPGRPGSFIHADTAGRESVESLRRDGTLADERIYDIISKTLKRDGQDGQGRSVIDRLSEPLGALPPSRGAALIERAEYQLRSILSRYKSSKRPVRHRARDLIRDLNETKILYRDAGNQHPSLLSRCKYRLSQIDELMMLARSQMH